MRSSECPNCGAALHPALCDVRVDARGVFLVCKTCAENGGPFEDEYYDDSADKSLTAEPLTETLVETPPPRWRSSVSAVLAFVAVAAVAFVVGRMTEPSTASGAMSRSPAAAIIHKIIPVPVLVPQATPETIRVGPPELITSDGQELIIERFPSLKSWIHPVSASKELVPVRSSRVFGAQRDGDRPPECLGGHCGVDLDGPRGTPIVAVAWGTIIRIQHSADGNGGRYVKLQHPEGQETYYMHLDHVASGLRRRDEVEAGTVLGTLGKTGILKAKPHLHFSLAIPLRQVDGPVRYIDPVPYLAVATVQPLSDDWNAASALRDSAASLPELPEIDVSEQQVAALVYTDDQRGSKASVTNQRQ